MLEYFSFFFAFFLLFLSVQFVRVARWLCAFSLPAALTQQFYYIYPQGVLPHTASLSPWVYVPSCQLLFLAAVLMWLLYHLKKCFQFAAFIIYYLFIIKINKIKQVAVCIL